jgi:hypothetical protein
MHIESIYWDPYSNDFTDDNGNLFADIFRIISPNRLLLMRLKRGTWYEKVTDVFTYELVFPLKEDLV